MSIRRMMLFTLNKIGDFYKILVSDFKFRVLGDGGTFEAETNLENQLNTLGSDLFDSVSLVITPNGVKTSKLYAIKPDNGSGDLTVTRATTATRVNEHGIFEEVGLNIPRIDYSLGYNTLLIEQTKTNLIINSDNPTNQVVAVTATPYVISFYGTGTITLSGAFSGSLVGTGANNRVSLNFTPRAENLTISISGVVSKLQLETGNFATSYIPTTTSTVTRIKDSIKKSNMYSSNIITSAGGTMIVKVSNNVLKMREQASGLALNTTSSVVGGNGVLLTIHLSRGNARLALRIYQNGTILAVIPTPADTSIIAFTWNGSSCSIYTNGTKYPIDYTFTTLIMENLTIESPILTQYDYIMFYPTPLTDTQAIQLTTL